MNLPLIPAIKSVTDLRYQTANILKLVDQNQPVVVTRGNDTVAVLLSPAIYQQTVHLLEEVEDNQAAIRLEKAIKKGGKFIDFKTFDKKNSAKS